MNQPLGSAEGFRCNLYCYRLHMDIEQLKGHGAMLGANAMWGLMSPWPNS